VVQIAPAPAGPFREPYVEPCEALDWDTTFWAIPIARVRGDGLIPSDVSRVDAWCHRHGIGCLYFLARSDDPTTTRSAEDGGFRLVDVRVQLRHLASRMHGDSPPPIGGLDVAVRPSRPHDVGSLQRIARDIYQQTRFFYDAGFPRERCRALYETWIARSCERYADIVFVAELGGAAVGYISCHLQAEVPGGSTGSIGLVGVSDRARGRCIGQALVRQALHWFSARDVQGVGVVTQGRNGAALHLYQQCGFFIEAMHLWYHKWYPPFGAEAGFR